MPPLSRYASRLSGRQQSKFHRVLREFKHHTLHSGSRRGPIVRKRGQAIAIAFSEARGMRRRRGGGRRRR